MSQDTDVRWDSLIDLDSLLPLCRQGKVPFELVPETLKSEDCLADMTQHAQLMQPIWPGSGSLGLENGVCWFVQGWLLGW